MRISYDADIAQTRLRSRWDSSLFSTENVRLSCWGSFCNVDYCSRAFFWRGLTTTVKYRDTFLNGGVDGVTAFPPLLDFSVKLVRIREDASILIIETRTCWALWRGEAPIDHVTMWLGPEKRENLNLPTITALTALLCARRVESLKDGCLWQHSMGMDGSWCIFVGWW